MIGDPFSFKKFYLFVPLVLGCAWSIVDLWSCCLCFSYASMYIYKYASISICRCIHVWSTNSLSSSFKRLIECCSHCCRRLPGKNAEKKHHRSNDEVGPYARGRWKCCARANRLLVCSIMISNPMFGGSHRKIILLYFLRMIRRCKLFVQFWNCFFVLKRLW